MGRESKPIRIDADFQERLGNMKRKVGEAQDSDVSIRELTRRMGQSVSIKAMELELLEDAKAKKRLRLR